MNINEIDNIYNTLLTWGMTFGKKHFSQYWLGSDPTYYRCSCSKSPPSIGPIARLAARLKQHAINNPITHHVEWLNVQADELNNTVQHMLHTIDQIEHVMN